MARRVPIGPTPARIGDRNSISSSSTQVRRHLCSPSDDVVDVTGAAQAIFLRNGVNIDDPLECCSVSSSRSLFRDRRPVATRVFRRGGAPDGEISSFLTPDHGHSRATLEG